MTLKEAMHELESRGDPKRRAHNTRYGAGTNQFGVALGDIRKLAKRIKHDQSLALSLWRTDNIDAQLLAVLIMKPEHLASDELDVMVRSVTFVHVADWLNAYVVKQHPERETLRQRWMADTDPMAARAGWSLTSERVANSSEEVDPSALLDRIESEMGTAHPHTQWTMNTTLAQIGIHLPEHRSRALAIGEKLGVYRDYPVSKGCTSPFAPIWINEMVRRQSPPPK